MTGIKIGDVVAWADVQSGWLVRTPDGAVCLRRGGMAIYMIGDPCMPIATVEWGDGPEVVIMAMDVPAGPTFETMRRLAEVYEVREAIQVIRNSERFMSAARAGTVAAEVGDTAGIRAAIADLDAAEREPEWDAYLLVGCEEVLVLARHMGTPRDVKRAAAERLHAAGWRPGDTAERAALLLRMHEHVQVREGDEALKVPAWEVARDLVACPVCQAPAGHGCVDWDDNTLLHEVHVERLDIEQGRGNA